MENDSLKNQEVQNSMKGTEFLLQTQIFLSLYLGNQMS